MTDRWEHTRLDHRSRQAEAIAGSALALLAERGAPALTMAAIAERADISRQTLYRYFKDIDAVLVGMAELVTFHDEAFIQLVGEQPDPRARLDLMARAATGEGHGPQTLGSLVALLPPAGREIVAQHHTWACTLLSEVLQAGIDDGSFRADLRPSADAPLILGLLDAADRHQPDRAIALVHQIVESQPSQPEEPT